MKNKFKQSLKYNEVFKLTGNFKYRKTMYQIGDKIEVAIDGIENPTENPKAKKIVGNVVGISGKAVLLLNKSKGEYKVISLNNK